MEVIRKSLTASTWRELKTNGKFGKNEKLSFICDYMLILGCDVGSETHYMRVIDTRGRELSKSAFPFNNDSEGFQSAKEWAVKTAEEHNKSQIALGLEPTGHYWFCLATWMISNGISVVQGNPYAVKQTKEVEDNSQLKNDTKDPKLIANLVKDGNFGMPYLPEKLYAELRRLSMFRDQLNEDRVRTINRMHREMKIYFPEYKDALGKVDGAFSLELLKQAPFPDDLATLGEDGIGQIWHDAKLRGRGYGRAKEIIQYAKTSVEIKDGADAGGSAVRWFFQKIRLRYWLFQAAKSAVAHAEESKELHIYYTTRADNPLKKMQSLIVIACKLLRIIYTILKNRTAYDPKKMLMDIRRPEKEVVAA